MRIHCCHYRQEIHSSSTKPSLAAKGAGQRVRRGLDQDRRFPAGIRANCPYNNRPPTLTTHFHPEIIARPTSTARLIFPAAFSSSCSGIIPTGDSLRTSLFFGTGPDTRQAVSSKTNFFSRLARYCPIFFFLSTMSSLNRAALPTSSMLPSDRVRHLWPAFGQSASKNRSLIDHKVKAFLAQADKDYEKTLPHQRHSLQDHNAFKARRVKEIKEPHFEAIRRQWENKLTEFGLRMEDWTDISAEEMAAVISVLGDPEENGEERTVPPRQSPPSIALPPSQAKSTASIQPVAPSLSSSTRSTNVSTASSYALVDPSEFHSEDEDSGFFLPTVVRVLRRPCFTRADQG
jgi:hypothetical protein